MRIATSADLNNNSMKKGQEWIVPTLHKSLNRRDTGYQHGSNIALAKRSSAVRKQACIVVHDAAIRGRDHYENGRLTQATPTTGIGRNACLYSRHNNAGYYSSRTNVVRYRVLDKATPVLGAYRGLLAYFQSEDRNVSYFIDFVFAAATLAGISSAKFPEFSLSMCLQEMVSLSTRICAMHCSIR